ncbi:uncharacterized protein A4U43_C07F38110 [Asparagus officinalis]|uniref:Bromo domain-containing protein n=1 Tax=Asparagus officinalis TaxID=4686 RepID=A0A5P1EI36_ASPOF|nr:transcription factor GTE9-like [Asparagus officinalis]ONK65536.1 uncharacterized protein A4U43_C07F38110 [Asparagus officinalis]
MPQKIIIKKRLKGELAQVRSKIENIGGDCERLLVNEFSSTVKNRVALREPCHNYENQDSMSRKRKSSEESKQQMDVCNFFYNDEDFSGEKSEAVSTVTGSFEVESPRRLHGENGKGQKMDICKIKQCGSVLMALMNHQSGWVFNQPVDPVKLKIPDYFSIIKKPMDLGTIKHRLERKHYSSTHHFAEDVRLTFSNAMRYNPPYNAVHMMAKDLCKIFNAKWKSLEFKWRKEPHQSVRKIPKKEAITSKQVLQRVPSCNTSSLACKSLTVADKLKLQNSLAKISTRNIPLQLLKFLQKSCLLDQNEERISVDIYAFDDETLWELHQILKNYGDAGCTESAGLVMNSKGQVEGCYKDVDSVRSSGTKSLLRCSTISTLDGDNISGVQGYSGNCNAVDRLGTAIVDLDDAHTSDHSSPVAATPHKEVEFPCTEQSSPTRALRAVMLKRRFADTILKAQQRTLLNHGEKVDPAKVQREREKLEKKQQEEKARIEAQVRATEAAAQLKAETELKMQREREREEARLALQKMQKTVDIDENFQIFKDLDNLGYSQPVHLDLLDEMPKNFMDAVEQQCALANPLAQLGLFMKEDDLDEEVGNWFSSTGDGRVEEGEIGSS